MLPPPVFVQYRKCAVFLRLVAPALSLSLLPKRGSRFSAPPTLFVHAIHFPPTLRHCSQHTISPWPEPPIRHCKNLPAGCIVNKYQRFPMYFLPPCGAIFPKIPHFPLTRVGRPQRQCARIPAPRLLFCR